MLKTLRKLRKNAAPAPNPDSTPARQRPQYLPGAVNEYYRDFVSTQTFRHPRKVLFQTGSHVFTMGSCFANEVRAFLETSRIGIVHPKISEPALAWFDEASKEESSWGAWNGISNLQYYNTFSIRQEIEKAAGVWQQQDDDFWEVPFADRTLYQCPYRRRIFARSPDKLRAITASLDTQIRVGLESAELLIFTLGLTEVWRKKNNGLIACCEPGYCHGGGLQETEFVASTLTENLHNVDATIHTIEACFGQKQILLSVSPVPLGRTFRPLEVTVANTESKSILRSVAGEISSRYDHVHYFPSYEMCLTDPNSFRPDGRHVTADKVNQIMGLFAACHVE